MILQNMAWQEVACEAGGPRAGDQLPERRHPAGRLLVAQVRPEAHQGLAVPAVSNCQSCLAPLIDRSPFLECMLISCIYMQRVLQVQHGAGVPGEEARGARPRRAGDAHRHLRGRPPPRCRCRRGTAGAHVDEQVKEFIRYLLPSRNFWE